MPLKVIDGKLLKVGSAIASADDCCCGGGDCDFGCTGSEPTLNGLSLDITAITGSGCTCVGDGTYMLPSASGGVTIPEFSGALENCYFCKYDIDLGECDQLISSHITCETESFPATLPPTLGACCGTYPDTFSGSIDGYEFCCKISFRKTGVWTAHMCSYFTAPSKMKMQFTVTGITSLVQGQTYAFVRYKRDYIYTKDPGSFPGPDCDLCTWSAAWDGDWYFDDGYDGTECPPPDLPAGSGGICDSTVQVKVWEIEVDISNCDEILDEQTLSVVTDPADDTLSCSVSVCIVEGEEWPGCVPASEEITVDADWGCMPSAVKMQWI